MGQYLIITERKTNRELNDEGQWIDDDPGGGVWFDTAEEADQFAEIHEIHVSEYDLILWYVLPANARPPMMTRLRVERSGATWNDPPPNWEWEY